MSVTIEVKIFLTVLVLAWAGRQAAATIMTKAFLQWTKDQYLLNGSSFHGWCPLEGHWVSPWNFAKASVWKGQVKYLLKVETSEVLQGQVSLVYNASTTATHLRGKPTGKGKKKKLYVADLTCANVGNKDHLYVVVLPVGGLRSNVAFYDMIRREAPSLLGPTPLSSAAGDELTVNMAEKEANPNPL